MLGDKGARYWIGVDDQQTTLQRYAGEGGLPLPRYYLVDVNGVVVTSDLPDETLIESLLEKVFEPALGRTLHERLAEAREAYERGTAGAAWKAAGKLVDGDDETVTADAVFLREKVERWAAWQRERIEDALAKGEHPRAMGELLVFEIRFAKMEVAAWAADRIRALKDHEAIHPDRFAWDKLRKALAKEAKGVGSRSARKSVVYAYAKIVKSHADTLAAKIAEERIAALGGE